MQIIYNTISGINLRRRSAQASSASLWSDASNSYTAFTGSDVTNGMVLATSLAA